MTRRIPRILLAASLLGPCPAFAQASPPSPQEAKAPASLDQEVRSALAGFRGKVWVYAKNLDSGAFYSLRGDERVRSASTMMEALGLKRTQALRKIGGGSPSRANADPVSRLFGIGVTTPCEMVTLLERLERGEIVSPEASREMIEILKREQYADGIGRSLYDVPIASKSGTLDRLRSDVAIVYTRRGRIAMAITCDDMRDVHYNPENPGPLMISRLSLLLLDGLAQ